MFLVVIQKLQIQEMLTSNYIVIHDFIAIFTAGSSCPSVRQRRRARRRSDILQLIIFFITSPLTRFLASMLYFQITFFDSKKGINIE